MTLFIFSFRRAFKERILLIIPFLSAFVILLHLGLPKSDEKRVIENNSFWQKKTFDKKKYQIIIGGDSRVYRGVSPEAMLTILPQFTILNFGYGSAGFDKIMLQQINKKLDYDAQTKMVILGITPLSLTNEAFRNSHLNYELSTKKEEQIELLYFKRVFQFFIPYTIESMGQIIQKKEYQPSRIQEYTQYGWVATTELKPWPESALKSYSTRFKNNQVTTENTEVLITQVRAWSENGVKVFGFRPPTTEKMVALEDSLSGFNEQQFIEKFSGAGGIWIPFKTTEYKSYDGSHLDKENASQFSVDLAVFIKNYGPINVKK